KPSEPIAQRENSPADEVWDFSLSTTPESTCDMSPSLKAELMLRQFAARQLRSSAEAIDSKASFIELGLTSMGMVELVQRIGPIIDATLSPSLLFDHTSIAEFSSYLGREYAPS